MDCAQNEDNQSEAGESSRAIFKSDILTDPAICCKDTSGTERLETVGRNPGLLEICEISIEKGARNSSVKYARSLHAELANAM